MTDNNRIVAEGIAYSYGDRLAVDHISFQVGEGEVLGFLGPNGAGKTTTLKMLVGLLVPQAGHITILGRDMVREREKVQAHIGVCFEEKSLYEDMSAAANLRFFASLFGIRNPDIPGLLERVGLLADRRDRVSNYSKGMKQRLMVARALVNQPSVLFLDEPTDGLDPVSSEAIRQVIMEEKARGVSVFLTTHDMMEADKLSDRVAFIHDGRIAAHDTPENLKHAYGKRVIKVRYREGGNVVEEEIPLDENGSAARVQEILSSREVLDMHTEEATLEDIFIRVTGEKLD
ncbi:MAG: ABC transporter ATP-binding protein [Actinobacteria bacterium]|nr:ABC transporter ATP-binding protein [Actinomycetota bacterium]